MAEFFVALGNPDVPFVRFALIAGLLASPAFGMIGTYVTVNRISYVAGGIAHATLGGIGAALYVQAQHESHWFTPLFGALAAAVLGALIIGTVSMYAREREDSVIGAVWAVGMAVGLLFIARAPGYVDPASYLFGSILLLSKGNLITIVVLDLVVLATGVLFYRQLEALSFDEEFARVRGINTGLLYMLLVLLIAIGIVLLTLIVGIILVIALLTIPPAIASMFARTLWAVMLLGAGLTALFSTVGMAASYAWDFPSGATIIVVAGGAYLLLSAGRAALRGRLRGS
jgi:zinc transport system permease protein